MFHVWLLWALSARAWDPVAPGVERTQWIGGGPNRITAFKVNLCHPGVRARATASAERGQRTSSWGNNRGVAVAVNGGYYLGGYAPDGVAGGNGAIWSDSWTSDWRGWVGFARGGPRFSTAGAHEWPTGVGEVVNGDATLVAGGVPQVCNCGGPRHPRTAVGTTADRRTMYLVTVDGRTSSSVGMTIDELAHLMASFGVERAMNLDGGGSTTAWVRGVGVVNRPSDSGGERTVANHLGVYATGGGLAPHCPIGHDALFVGSEFPGGGLTIRGEAGSTVSGALSFQNTGTETWDWAVRLAPLPRDATSPLATADWLAVHRIAPPTATTPAGAVGRFPFSVKIPDVPGTTTYPLSFVHDGVVWFGDSWGPADGSLVLTVVSDAVPAWRALASPGGDVELAAHPGDDVVIEVTLTNTGTATWPGGTVRLGTTGPRDHVSALQAADWLGPNRAAAVWTDLPRGGTVTVPVTLRAPAEPGVYDERFGLVAEAVTWFADQGGPADDWLRVHLTVYPETAHTGADDTGLVDTDVVDTDIVDTALDTDIAETDVVDTDVETGDGDTAVRDGVTVVGCACDQRGGTSAFAPIALVVALRRRRRRA
jgi:hypothetical protein